MKLRIVIFLSLSFPCLMKAATWTRQDLINKAISESPSLTRAQENVLIAQLESKNADVFWFPTLDLEAIHGRQGASPIKSTSDWYSETSLLLKENLYDNGESYRKSRAQKLKKEIAELEFKDLKARTIVSLSEAYFNYCFSEQSLKLTEKYDEELQRQLNWVSTQYKSGIKTRKDFLRFKSQSFRSELEVIQTRSEIEKNKIDLFQRIGITEISQEKIDCTNSRPFAYADLPAAVENPIFLDEEVLEKQKIVSDLQNETQRRKLWPEVFLTAAATYGSSNYIDTGSTFKDNETTSWNALVTLKWNLLDWGVRSRQIDIQEARERAAQKTVELNLISKRKEWLDFQNNKAVFTKSYRTAKELEKIEKDNFASLDQEYRMGRVSYLDLTTALSNNLNAQAKSLQYEFELQKHVVRTQYFQGKLYE